MEMKSSLCAVQGCNNPGIHGKAGSDRRYCGDHLWTPSPPDPGQTCDMIGANAPSLDRCGRHAVVKWTSAFGEVKGWCERCRREHFPTNAEKATDKEAACKAARSAELWDKYVFSPLGWVLRLAVLALAIYGVIWFIHWCWRNS